MVDEKLIDERKNIMDVISEPIKKIFGLSNEDYCYLFYSLNYTFLGQSCIPNFIFSLFFQMLELTPVLSYAERRDYINSICLSLSKIINYKHFSEYDFLGRQINFLLDEQPLIICEQNISDFQVYEFNQLLNLTDYSIFFALVVQNRIRNLYITNFRDIKISVNERIRNTEFLNTIDLEFVNRLCSKFDGEVIINDIDCKGKIVPGTDRRIFQKMVPL